MTMHWAFRHLGIAPTSETSVIRQAYAKRLRAMDLDRDVDGYARLRNARDAALAHVSGHFVEDPAEYADDNEELGAGIVAEPSSESESLVIERESDQPPVANEEQDEIGLAQQRIISLLFPQGSTRDADLDPAETDDLLSCFETLKLDPRLDQIDTLALAGDWFANVIASSLPRSDPIVRPTSAFFGWTSADELLAHPAITAVVARAAALDWRDQLQRPSHRFHRAWKELTKPADENSGRGWVSKRRVTELLKTVRTRHPSLEADMDWYRVSLWERAANGERSWGTPLVLLIVLFIQVVRSCVNEVPSPNQPAGIEQPKSPLTNSSADIDAVIRNITGEELAGDRVKHENAPLYAMLETNWQLAKENGTSLADFEKSMQDMLVERIERSWSVGSYDLLRDKMIAKLDVAREISSRDCAAFLGGFDISAGGSGPKHAQNRMFASALLEIDPRIPLGSEPTDRFEYRIPSPVIVDAMTRSGFSRDQLASGLALNPPTPVDPVVACRARIVLREAILAQPKGEALKILRDMEN